MTVRTSASLSLLTALSFGLACGSPDAASDSGGGGGPRNTVRDSAGVTIVESARPAWSDPWVVEDSATLIVGDSSGALEYEFDGVTGAFRLSDGRLVVGDRGTRELRWYSETGTHLRSTGRQGEGPGEFQFLGKPFWMPGDSVAVYDPRQMRVSVFDSEGAFARSVQVDRTRLDDPGLFGLEPIAGLPGGGLLLVGGHGGSALIVMMAPDQSNYTDRYSMKVYRADEGTGSIAPVVTLPGRDIMGVQMANGPTTMLYEFPAPVPRFGAAAARGHRWVAGANDRYELLVGGGDGAVERIVRPSIEPRPLTSAVRDSAVAVWMELYNRGEEDSRAENALRDLADDHLNGLASLPFFSTLLVDAEDNLWARDYGVTGSDSNVWTVFDPEGIWLESVTMPSGIDVLSIGSDHVVARSRTDLDVEMVSVHTLVKP